MPLDPPFLPIIYVRGYAGTQRDVEDTVADPFMGFNLGSSKIRQRWTGKVERFYFESPFLRLMKDFHYSDTFHGDKDMPLPDQCPARSVFIYRYYDVTSSDFGTGQRLTVEDAARGLNDLVLRIRDIYSKGASADADKFRVVLVGHSMGGLICRCFLQNLNVGDPAARKAVDKVFTYATPHNGIDFDLLGNLPGFLSFNDANNFNRTRMAEYLALPKGTGDVSDLNGKFDPNRFFNLVGTNDRDYEAAGTLSRRAVGPMSDGLVRIVNATTFGRTPGTVPNADRINSPRAFVYRSHSGYYGIVNSEEGYQNLNRFLFGNVRVDGQLLVNSIALPAGVEKAMSNGSKVRASYHIEAIVRVRGQLWDLSRRVTNENSAVFRSYDDLVPLAGAPPTRSPTLFSLFLSSGARVDTTDPSLGFSLDLGVVVPEYEVDGKLWSKDHYEGGYLYRHKINFEATPPAAEGDWIVKYGFDVESPNDVTTNAALVLLAGGAVELTIPVVQATQPGINATLKLIAAQWS
jgi:pimeloyl-ACP methyl ester carboxylesterase